MNIKTTLKSSVAAAALFAIAAPVAPSVNAADDTLSSGNKNSLKISGYVARSIYYASDGESDAVFIADGSTSETRVRWVASGKLNENVSAGALIEMELPHSNSADAMTLGTVGNAGVENVEDTAWGLRQQMVWVKHKKMGKISLGNTNSASNGKSETTFSGTNMVDLSSAKPFGGAITFLDTTLGTNNPRPTGPTVGAAFTNLDGRSRTDVLRYDTPSFAGLGLAVSLIAGGNWDVGANYKAKLGGVRLRVQAQYNNVSADSNSTVGSASASIGALHDSGLNAAFAYGERHLNGDVNAGRGDDGNFWYFNVGYRAKVFSVGGTNISFSYQRTSDIVQNNSDADSVGFSVAQIFKPIGANAVFSYRNYSYDTDTNTFEDVDVISLQTIFNF